MPKAKPYTPLEDLGLPPYEARAYAALLAYPAAPAAAIAREARIPRPHVYKVLRQLHARGFLTRTSGNHVTYRPAPPAEVLAQLEEEEEKRRARREEAAAAAKAALTEIYAAARDVPAPEEFIKIVKTPAQIQAYLHEFVANARERVLSFNKAPYATAVPPRPRARLRRVYSPFAAAVKRGVKFQALFEMAEPADETERQVVAYLAAQGEEVRIAPRLPMKMVVVDGRNSILTLEDPSTATPVLTSVVISHHALAAALELSFAKLWGDAVPYAAWLASDKETERGG